MTEMPQPYRFRGGEPSDYRVEVGPAGTFLTRHLPSNTTIQSVVRAVSHAGGGGGGTVPILGAVNLAVGVLDLGVSVYNAYQVREVRKGMEVMRADLASNQAAVEAHFADVKGGLRVLSSMYERLEDGQRDLTTLVREEFRLSRELELAARLARFDYVYSMFPRSPATEADRVIDAAVDLISYLNVLIDRHRPGDPVRLVLASSKAQSVIGQSDGYLAKAEASDDERPVTLARHLREGYLAELRQEATTYLSEAPLFDLAVSQGALTESVALILRGVEHSCAGGSVLDLPSPEVNEVLQPVLALRALSTTTSANAPTSIELRTAADYVALAEWAGVSLDDLVVADHRSVAVRELAAPTGVPPEAVTGEAEARMLLAWSPARRRAAREGVLAALNLPQDGVRDDPPALTREERPVQTCADRRAPLPSHEFQLGFSVEERSRATLRLNPGKGHCFLTLDVDGIPRTLHGTILQRGDETLLLRGLPDLANGETYGQRGPDWVIDMTDDDRFRVTIGDWSWTAVKLP